MSYTVTENDILSIPADGAVLALEMTGRVALGPAGDRLARAGGETLRQAIRKAGFVSVGRAAALEDCGLPFGRLILTATPRFLTGKANELKMLRLCYESVFALADELGLRTLALPFLSTMYYRFPQAEGVHIALQEAESWSGEARFAAETPELLALSRTPYRRPRIVSYVGWYRDQAIFRLDNGHFARVDLRPERREADTVPYVEACCHAGNNPLQTPLPPEEIDRLRRLWEELNT
jgi:O-acetyl-ADP-ribose deacetylase (regulator of RNase III)